MTRQIDQTDAHRQYQFGVFLGLLVAADLAFILVHVMRDLPPFYSNVLYSLETDRGFAEMFQYVKFYWVAMLLAMLGWRARQHVYFAWSLLFAYLLADDAIGLHEHFGGAFARSIKLQGVLGLRGVDLGELAVSGLIAVVFLLLILLACLRSPRSARNASKRLAIYVGALAFFGVLIDMVHVAVGAGYFEEFLGALEDGGEMLVISIICWFALNLMIHHGALPVTLRQLTATGLGTLARQAPERER